MQNLNYKFHTNCEFGEYVGIVFGFLSLPVFFFCSACLFIAFFVYARLARIFLPYEDVHRMTSSFKYSFFFSFQKSKQILFHLGDANVFLWPTIYTFSVGSLFLSAYVACKLIFGFVHVYCYCCWLQRRCKFLYRYWSCARQTIEVVFIYTKN